MRKLILLGLSLIMIFGCKFYFASFYENRKISEDYYGKYRYEDETEGYYRFYKDDESRLRINSYDAENEISNSYVVEFPAETNLIFIYNFYPDISFNSYVYYLDLEKLTIASLDWDTVKMIYPQAEITTEELNEYEIHDVIRIEDSPQEFQKKILETEGAIDATRKLVRIE